MSLSTDVLSNDPLYGMKLSGRRTGLLCLKQDVVWRGVWGRGVPSSSWLVVLSVVMVVVVVMMVMEVVWWSHAVHAGRAAPHAPVQSSFGTRREGTPNCRWFVERVWSGDVMARQLWEHAACVTVRMCVGVRTQPSHHPCLHRSQCMHKKTILICVYFVTSRHCEKDRCETREREEHGTETALKMYRDDRHYRSRNTSFTRHDVLLFCPYIWKDCS